jgi:hypothetical protein
MRIISNGRIRSTVLADASSATALRFRLLQAKSSGRIRSTARRYGCSVVPIAPQRQKICLDRGREASPGSTTIRQEIVEDQRDTRLVVPCGREAVGQARVVPSKFHGTYRIGKRCEPRPCYRQQDVGRLRLAPCFVMVRGRACGRQARVGIHDFATLLGTSIDAIIEGLGLEKSGGSVNGGHDFRGPTFEMCRRGGSSVSIRTPVRDPIAGERPEFPTAG